jgi:uncharacterized protein (DUF302 family)
MSLPNIAGFISEPSKYSVDEATQRLQELLRTKGAALFAVIDHSGEAAKVGMQMRPTKLLIFGNPHAGTPVMLATPTAAIDLPLKILIWEDADDKVWLSYNDPAYLGSRHIIPDELLGSLAVVKTLAATAGQ